jgi:hypothetical protein
MTAQFKGIIVAPGSEHDGKHHVKTLLPIDNQKEIIFNEVE